MRPSHAGPAGPRPTLSAGRQARKPRSSVTRTLTPEGMRVFWRAMRGVAAGLAGRPPGRARGGDSERSNGGALGALMPLVAYFSMEYGLHEEFASYAGGLGVLAGDFMKSAGDLGPPVVGIGLRWAP